MEMLSQRQAVATPANHHHHQQQHLYGLSFYQQHPQQIPQSQPQQQQQQQQINHRQQQLLLLQHHHHHHPSSAHPLSQAPPQYHDPALASLAYRPLHLPVQQQTPTLHFQPQPALIHHPQQLTLATTGTATNHYTPTQHPPTSSLPFPRTRAQSRHQQPRDQQQHQQRQQHQQQHQQRPMASDYPDPQTGADDLAELQKLSEQYHPEALGPLVGQRQPSTAITTEYASADPIYQAKTAALPRKYSHYRTIRGDGKCGWRAVAFGYFEALIHHGDSTRFSLEEARLQSMSNVMVNAGFVEMLFEDFADETFALLRKTQMALPVGNANEVLLEAFNDDMIQNYIITHLRTITAAWMKTHEENYTPWLLGQTVDEYCESTVLPVAAEIDHVGLVALKDAVLSPADMSLEVMYLDRSEGSEVTMHRFEPVTGGAHPMGFVRLLYRPGHYDLLYKDDLPAPLQPAAVPTYLQLSSPDHEVYGIEVSNLMTSIPGMSYANLPSHSWMSSDYNTDTNFFGNSTPVQPCPQGLPTPSVQAPEPHLPDPSDYAPATASAQPVTQPAQAPHELTIRTSAPRAALANPDFHQQLSGGPFRPSAWQLEPGIMSVTSQIPLQTSIFRNSHFNTAHFLNPDFQPEQWDPEDEYTTASCSSSSKSSRPKSSA